MAYNACKNLIHENNDEWETWWDQVQRNQGKKYSVWISMWEPRSMDKSRVFMQKAKYMNLEDTITFLIQKSHLQIVAVKIPDSAPVFISPFQRPWHLRLLFLSSRLLLLPQIIPMLWLLAIFLLASPSCTSVFIDFLHFYSTILLLIFILQK